MTRDVRRLKELATYVEQELQQIDTDCVAGAWALQALVRLHLTATLAARSATQVLPESAYPLCSMRETRNLLSWLDPADADRLQRRLDEFTNEMVMTCLGECLLDDLLGKGA